MFKKIFAVVTEKDFYNFRDRSRAEGMNIDEAFRALVHAYSIGGVVECCNKKGLDKFKVSKDNNANYLKGKK